MENPINNFPRLKRALEIMPGALIWATFIIIPIFSFFRPLWVTYFVIIYGLNWLFKALNMSMHLIYSFWRLKREVKIDWRQRCENLDKDKITLPGAEDWKDIYHLIIFPTYKESIEVLDSSFRALTRTNYTKDRMIVVLAIEERDKENAFRNAQIIEKRYGDKFFIFKAIMHPNNIVGELKGKGANATWAAKEIKKEIDKLRIPYEHIIVSNFDIDSCVHKQYFSYLTYTYLTTPNPTHASYQPIPMYHNNLWDAPALMRIVATGSSFWQMIEAARPERLKTFSSHSMSFRALVDVDFWRTDIVSEDSGIFWQCFLYYDGDYKVVPLFIPISMDTLLADTYWKTMVNQYKQKRRWAYGVEHVPYVIGNFLVGSPKMSVWKKIVQGWRLVEGLYSWATGVIIITFLGWLPYFLGRYTGFEGTVLAQSFPWMFRAILNLALFGLLITSVISTLLLPPKPKKYSCWIYVWMVFQWVLQPIAGIFFGAIPAIDAQTRFMLGKYMGFWTTEKVRKCT